MVPSITAVDRRGVPRLPGLLYGDARARRRRWADAGARRDAANGEREEGARMVAWAVAERPDAAGYWSSQAVATHALCGVPAVDSAAASIFGSLVPAGRWDRDALAVLGLERARLAPDRPHRGAGGHGPRRVRPWSAVDRSTPSASRSWPGPTNPVTCW